MQSDFDASLQRSTTSLLQAALAHSLQKAVSVRRLLSSSFFGPVASLEQAKSDPAASERMSHFVMGHPSLKRGIPIHTVRARIGQRKGAKAAGPSRAPLYFALPSKNAMLDR